LKIQGTFRLSSNNKIHADELMLFHELVNRVFNDFTSKVSDVKI